MEATTSTHVSDSDVARRDLEQQEEAVAVYERYYDPATDQPTFELDIDTYCHSLAKDPSVPLAGDDLLTQVQQQLDKLAWDKLVPGAGTRLGRVSVDLTGRFGKRDWSLPPYENEHGELVIPPQLVFVQLVRSQRLYEAGVRQAAALHYLPPAGVRTKPDTYNPGEMLELSIDGEWAGYLGVARWFGSRAEALEALAEFRNACRVLRRRSDDTAYEPDPVRSAISPEDIGRATPLI
jgi:hypothetical protein